MQKIPVTSLDHLKQLANGEDGQPPLELTLVFQQGLVQFTKHIQYVPMGNGRHWWIEEEGYFTEPQLHRFSSVPRAIHDGAAFACLDEENQKEKEKPTYGTANRDDSDTLSKCATAVK